MRQAKVAVFYLLGLMVRAAVPAAQGAVKAAQGAVKAAGRSAWVALCLSLELNCAARAAETIQFDITPLLNARPVTTVANGKLVSWSEPIDGGGSGEATMAAGKLMGDAVPKALPDDGRFPANDKHPEVILHFSNADAAGKQVHRSPDEDVFGVDVPAREYARVAIFCMSGNGSSALTAKLFYQDGSETRSLTVPDWYNQLDAKDTARFYLGYDLAKWDKGNHKMENNHHYLFGLELFPSPGRVLTRFEITKTKPSVLTFWGATGVAEGSTRLAQAGKADIGPVFSRLSPPFFIDGLGRSILSVADGPGASACRRPSRRLF